MTQVYAWKNPKKIRRNVQFKGKDGAASNVKTWMAGIATVRTHPSEGAGRQPVLGTETPAATVRSMDGPLLRRAHLCAELL